MGRLIDIAKGLLVVAIVIVIASMLIDRTAQSVESFVDHSEIKN